MWIERAIAAWSKLENVPGGKTLYSKFVGKLVPYSGGISPLIKEFESGRAVVEIKESRALRNHFHTIHAVALTNLGELTSGLAYMSIKPPEYEGIVTALHSKFKKKARGWIIAEAYCEWPGGDVKRLKTEATLRNEAGDIVAIVTAEWTLRKK